MKIGAGGLQSLLNHDNLIIKQLDPARTKGGLEEQRFYDHNLVQKPVNEADLFKALDRLNKAAQMFNYPLMFKMERDKKGNLRVRVYNKQTGEYQELQPHQALKFSQELESPKGKRLDDYA